VSSTYNEQSQNLFHVKIEIGRLDLEYVPKMASLLRTRIVPRLMNGILSSRPSIPRIAMIAMQHTAASRLDDLAVSLEGKKEEMEKLQKEIQELEDENERLQKTLDEDEEEDTVDRESLEEALDELEVKLDEVSTLVDEIRNCLR
jgi:uncharacterized protein (DUF342 family)